MVRLRSWCSLVVLSLLVGLVTPVAVLAEAGDVVLVGSDSGAGSSSSFNVAASVAPAGGDLLVLGVAGGGAVTIDSSESTWTLAQGSDDGKTQLWYKIADGDATDTDVTFSMPSANQYGWVLAEYASTDGWGTDPLDVSAFEPSSGYSEDTYLDSGTTVAPTGEGLGVTMFRLRDGDAAAGLSFTNGYSLVASDGTAFGNAWSLEGIMAANAATTTTAQSTTATWSNGTRDGRTGVVAVFLPANPQPALIADTGLLALSADPDGVVVSDTVTVTTSDAVTGVTVDAVADDSGGGWLSVDSQATTPAVFSVAADPAGLTPGDYAGTVTTSAAGYTDVVVDVTFTVESDIALVSTVSGAASASSFTVQTAAAPAVGNLLVIGVAGGDAVSIDPSESTWTLAQAADVDDVSMWYKIADGDDTDTDVTFSMPGANQYAWMVAEYSAAAGWPTEPLDATGFEPNSGYSSDTEVASGNTATPTTSGLGVAMLRVRDGDPIADLAFTNDYTLVNSGGTAFGQAWSIEGILTANTNTDTTPQSTIATWTNGDRHGRTGVIAVFTPNASDPSGDPDEDGLSDELENQLGTSPTIADTDADGIDDGTEFLLLYPWADPVLADTDGDGINDALEDIDGDGKSAAQEIADGTDPLDPDTDGDGLDDAVDPVPIAADSDGDGLDDAAEGRLGTNPSSSDSDGDGISDGDDTYTTLVDEGSIAVTVEGVGDLPGGLHIADLGDDGLRPDSIVGSVFSVSLESELEDSLDAAQITVSYDPALVTGSESDLRLLHWSDDIGMWLPAADDAEQIIDTVANTVTSPTEHFSMFAVGDGDSARAYWSQNSAEIAACSLDSAGSLVFADGTALLELEGTGWSSIGTAPRGDRFRGVVTNGQVIYTWNAHWTFVGNDPYVTSYMQRFDETGSMTEVAFPATTIRNIVTAGDEVYALTEPFSSPTPLNPGWSLQKWDDTSQTWSPVATDSGLGGLEGEAIVTQVGTEPTLVWSDAVLSMSAPAVYRVWTYTETGGLVQGTIDSTVTDPNPGPFAQYQWGPHFDLGSTAYVGDPWLPRMYTSQDGLAWSEQEIVDFPRAATVVDDVAIVGAWANIEGVSDDEHLWNFNGNVWTLVNEIEIPWTSAVTGPDDTVYLAGFGKQGVTDGGVFRTNDNGGTLQRIATSTELWNPLHIAWKDGVPPVDTDDDGLNDCLETVGLPTLFGIITTDPTNPDHDGDGLLDGTELPRVDLTQINIGGETASALYGIDVAYPGWSNPHVADTDGDTADDFVEFNWGSSPLFVDTDRDGYWDDREIDSETDPRNRDTDGDGYSDDWETLGPQFRAGFDPLVFDKPLTVPQWIAQFSRGGFCGAVDAVMTCEPLEGDDYPWFLGYVGGVVTPAADLSEILGGLAYDDKVAIGAGLVGLLSIPDGPKLVDDSSLYVARVSNLGSYRAVRRLLRRTDLAPETRRALVRLLDGSDEIVAKGLSQGAHVDEDAVLDVMAFLVERKQRQLRRLVDTMDHELATVRFHGPLFYGPTGLARHDSAVGFLDDSISSYRQSERGRTFATAEGDRIVDLVTTEKSGDDIFQICHEVKTGYINIGAVRNEINKDAKLKGTSNCASVIWHFYASGYSGSIGPAQRVLDELAAKGIGFEIHVPTRLE